MSRSVSRSLLFCPQIICRMDLFYLCLIMSPLLPLWPLRPLQGLLSYLHQNSYMIQTCRTLSLRPCLLQNLLEHSLLCRRRTFPSCNHHRWRRRGLLLFAPPVPPQLCQPPAFPPTSSPSIPNMQHHSPLRNGSQR